VKPTDVENPEYFHKVVDCQYACPAHTPVPEYIRLIAAERYTDAYMINWESNVFPGVLGRTCDRPCEPACRRGRVEDTPVAICRLKRVCADLKEPIKNRLPEIPKERNGFRIALIGAGPASLTVARDLMPLGYEVDLYDEHHRAGGFMRSQIPSFRLPEAVLNEEIAYILDMGVTTIFNTYVDSLKKILDKTYDAVFVGTGAPHGRNLILPGYEEEGTNAIRIGIEWLADIAFGHVDRAAKRVIVLGGGNTAMDCCRTAIRLGAEEINVLIRSPFSEVKASAWEIEDAKREGIPMHENHKPVEYLLTDGKLSGVRFEKVTAVYDDAGKRTLVPTGEEVIYACDTVLLAIGQENAFPWIERDIGLEFGKWDMPVVDPVTFQSTNPKVFFGGDAAFGPENIITAVAHGHAAALSIDMFVNGRTLTDRPGPGITLISQKMGIHDWSYASEVTEDERNVVPQVDMKDALHSHKLEVELGFDPVAALGEAQRCLNCDVQTVFKEKLCIECDACIDVCPVDCLTFAENEEESVLRETLKVPARNLTQDLYVSEPLPTGRVMVKDEDVCLHCGLCAERCPTAAWDMQKFLYITPQASKKQEAHT